MQNFLANLLRSTSILTALFLAACGGGGGSSATPVAPAPAATYSVSATVTGLQAGQFVTILDNGGTASTATANGVVTLATTLDSGDSYNVTIGTQSAAQTCNVVNGTGTVGSANVTNVQVNCGPLFAYVANFNSNNVSAYTIDATSGALTVVANSPFAAGTNPASVTVDPSGKFAYVANDGSNNVSAYTINAVTGALVQVTGSPFATGGAPFSITVGQPK